MYHKHSNHCGKCKLVIRNKANQALYCVNCAESIRNHRNNLNNEIYRWQGRIKLNRLKLQRMNAKTIKLRLAR